VGEGVLELGAKGFGFLRSPQYSYLPHPTDIFVSPDLVSQFGLRPGLLIRGETRPPHGGRGGPQLAKILTINKKPPEKYAQIIPFDRLTTVDPQQRLKLETKSELLEMRVMDLVSPLGRGTRGLIVAPPRTGKTTLLKQIANAVAENHPEVSVIMLLIDERPEEVTDFRRTVKAEVIASSNDMDIATHVRLAQFVIELARRKVEFGEDVFILLDSITRTARAFNNWIGNTGRTMTGGLDVRAMEIPRKIFAAARKTEEAGSLTIVATALIDTGSKMDEFIFQEFKGTGNCELVLSRELADRRIFPAIDIPKSGTRKEEKLFPKNQLEAIYHLRRELTDLKPVEAMEALKSSLKKFKTNDEFLKKITDVVI
jgi:transcription termination factor Rho